MTEIESVGSIFAGLGLMAVLFVMAYMLYQISRIYKQISDKNERYDTLEMCAIDKFAESKGVDLPKEIAKYKLSNKKSFGKELEKQIISEYFAEKKK